MSFIDLPKVYGKFVQFNQNKIQLSWHSNIMGSIIQELIFFFNSFYKHQLLENC